MVYAAEIGAVRVPLQDAIAPLHPVKPGRTQAMWYFTWILGIGVALGFGIINVMWLDANGKLLNGENGAQPPE
jgi:cytochrome bd-I ubiquinol oxidase subunit X